MCIRDRDRGCGDRSRKAVSLYNRLVLQEDSRRFAVVPVAVDQRKAGCGLQAVDGHLHGLNAVSYTHLDVYKRQAR